MKKLAVLAFCVLTGCASPNPQAFSGPDGGTAYTMKCSGYGRDWDDCYKEAGRLCPNGYDIVGQNSGVGGVVPAGSGAVIVNKQNMAIECH